MRELRMVPERLFSWDFGVFDGDEPIARVERAWIRERGRFSLEGRRWTIEREGWAGPWKLHAEGERTAHASAAKPSALGRTFEITSAARRWTLRPAGVFAARWVLLRGTREVGELVPERPFSRRATLRVPDELDLPTAVLVGFLVSTIRKRQAMSGSGG